VRSMSQAVRPGGALVLHWNHSQPFAEGPGLIGVMREVAATRAGPSGYRSWLTVSP
jgi:hypothetical protein